MAKIDRIRNILIDNEIPMLDSTYDTALLGICHSGTGAYPVYSYLRLVEVFMSDNLSEEAAVQKIEDSIITNKDFIIVDDTGV